MSGVNDTTFEDATFNSSERRILFLQGPLSPLFRLIGEHLEEMGFQVFRINFCAGDWLHWHGSNCTNFKKPVRDWSQFIEEYLKERRITDLVLHGDQRIYHRIAVSKARCERIYVAVTELGALRPGWMTLERNGLSTLSHFPVEPQQIRSIAREVGEPDLAPRFPSSFWLETAPDVIYNLTNVLFRPFFPDYEKHTIYPPIEEYLRGAIRLVRQKGRRVEAERVIDALINSRTRYFVLPLQLEGDFQLRRHSPYSSFCEVLETVFASFAEFAPKDTHLVLKSHPLDAGFEDWPGTAETLANKWKLQGRVHFLDGGGLAAPFEAATGVVTLNSTAGLEALQAGIPVKTLVPAHFDIEGLTHQGPLCGFWSMPEEPDGQLLQSYILALAGTTQVRGSIHNREGVRVAARNIADRIARRELNSCGAFVDPPPRLKAARMLGIRL